MGVFTGEVMRRHAPDFWFPLSHAEAIRAHPRLALRALCDVDPAALDRAALAYPEAASYVDARRLLDEVRPRLVGIATRTIGRADLIGIAIGAGVRALHVEKPLCNSVRELAAIEAALERSGALVTYGAIRRHLAPYRRARELADSGRFGALREIRVNLGGGTLFWTHPHSIDLILFGAGDRSVSGVQARLGNVSSGATRLDVVSDPLVIAAMICFDDGVTGHITRSLGSDFVLSCSEGEIAVRADGATTEIYATPEGQIYPVATPFDAAPAPTSHGGTLAPIARLVAALDDDATALADVAVVTRDMLRGQRILFAMLQSHLAQSRIVDPAEIDESLVIQARSGDRHA